jgi:RNA polymerase sigma-70 factor (ECF subfamily)
MDELTLLRNTRDDLEGVSSSALDRGRAALLDHVAESFPVLATRTRRRRRRTAATLASVAAVALGTTLVLTDVVGFAGWRGGADPAAAAALDDASRAAIESEDPVLARGQFLRLEESAVNVGWWPASSDPGEESSVAVFTATESDLYIPADTADAWVWLRPLARTYGAGDRASNEIADAVQSSNVAEVGAEHVERLRAPGGRWYGEPAASRADFDALPRDPYRLLNFVYRQQLGSNPASPDQVAFQYFSDQLRGGLVPADLRAAMFDALAMIPGVVFADGAANLDGRTGTAIGRVDQDIRWDILIDPSSGRFLGERQVLLEAVGNLAAGATLSWTAVTTSVVDAAPTGGTPYGDLEGVTVG